MNAWQQATQFAQEHPNEVTLAVAVVLGAMGLWLLLPRAGARGRRVGAVLALAALVLLAARLPRLTETGWFTQALFWITAAVTLASAAGAVTLPVPAYCAISFALTLLGTAALLLFQGAQFLAVATVAVYAGAILVTFLFVLMLAQPKGDAASDRVSWEPLLAAAAGAVLIGVLSFTVIGAIDSRPAAEGAMMAVESSDNPVMAPAHMASFGGQLFSRHLVAVEAAGTLLLVAVVGAVAIATWKTTPKPGEGGRSDE